MRVKTRNLILKYLIIAIISILLVLPYLWMITTSLKQESKIFLFPPQWFPNPIRWLNYLELFTKYRYGLYLWNSFKVSALTTAGTVLVATLAAYAFAKIKFPGRDFFFLLILSAMMLPVEVITIPLFLGLSKLHLTDTHFSLIVPAIFGAGGAFGLFLIRQFFLSIPDELIEAAKIDGCSHFRIFLKIMIPLAASPIATMVIYTFLNTWNDYFVPLIFLNTSDLYTSTLALALFTNEVGTTWNLVMAAAVLSTLPLLIVFFLMQRKFIESFTLSGIK